MNEVQLNNGVSIPAIGIGPAAARSGNLNLKSDIPLINLDLELIISFVCVLCYIIIMSILWRMRFK